MCVWYSWRGASLELLSELERGGCEFEAVGHEGAAALMAGGFGRVTGIPGVSLSIKGPGFANLLGNRIQLARPAIHHCRSRKAMARDRRPDACTNASPMR
ncbi:MAG: hypothetical protein IPJ55_17400 [Chloracidobacterium sp.]|nr:hypothetical protein [Chloracidobacterium sp.]